MARPEIIKSAVISVDLKGDSGEINSLLSRAVKSLLPDYLFLAKRISFKGDWVQLYQATLSIKGVKVLYLPSFTFNIKEQFVTKD